MSAYLDTYCLFNTVDDDVLNIKEIDKNFVAYGNNINGIPIIDAFCGGDIYLLLGDGTCYCCTSSTIWNNKLLHANKIDIMEKITSVACGSNHLLCLNDSGRVYVVGDNKYGQCGSPKNGVFYPELVDYLVRRNNIYHPELIDHLNIRKIFAGFDHSAFVNDKNECYVFGRNDDGELGVYTMISNNPNYEFRYKIAHYEPVKLELKNPLESKNHIVKEISFGYSHTLFLTESHDCYMAGNNECGQLATLDQNPKKICVPNSLSLPNDKKIANISTSHCSSFWISEDGEVYASGMNSSSELGTYCKGICYGCQISFPGNELVKIE